MAYFHLVLCLKPPPPRPDLCELASQPLKRPITLELLISTLASNKASPLGASLYNTYKNITYQRARVGAGAYACARVRLKYFFFSGLLKRVV